MTTTLEFQRRLYALGFNPGPVDGIPGRKTQAAIKAFQQNRHLEIDGIVGPKTWAALQAEGPATNNSTAIDPPWMTISQHLLGITEGAGSRNNPMILNWAATLDLAYQQDSIAWCGLFAAHCISAALPDEALPTNPLGARNWLSFGEPASPRYGAVLVFWRDDRFKSFHGHVGFYVTENTTSFRVRAGNQGDKVSDAWISKSRLLGARWPLTARAIETNPIVISDSGELSTNEA